MSKRVPRLEMADLEPGLAAALKPRVDRLGYLGEYFKCMGNLPEVCLTFLQFTEALKKALPDRITEVVALTIAGATGNAYERNQHERLSVKLGFGQDWVRAVNALDPAAPGPMTDAERETQAFALKALKQHGQSCQPDFERLIDAVGVNEALAVLMLIGRYATHAIAVNTLDLAPPKPSIFDAPP